MSKSWFLLNSVAFGIGFLVSLPLTKDAKQSLLTGLTAIPAASAGALVVTQKQKRSLQASFSSLHDEIHALQQQLSTQQTTQHRLNEEVADLEAQKQTLNQEVAQLRGTINKLGEQENQANYALARIEQERVQLQDELTRLNSQFARISNEMQAQSNEQQGLEQSVVDLRGQHTQLQRQIQDSLSQIQNFENQKLLLQLALSEIDRTKQQQEVKLTELQSELLGLEARSRLEQEKKAELDQEMIALRAEHHRLTTASQDQRVALEQLDTQFSTQLDQSNQLEQDIASLQLQRDQLLQELQEAENRPFLSEVNEPQIAQPVSKAEAEEMIDLGHQEPAIVQPDPTSDRVSTSEVVQPQTTRFVSSKALAIPDINLSRPAHARYLWEEHLQPHWAHRERPIGQRFLGSLKLQRTITDDVLDVVGQNLRKLDRLTEANLYGTFDKHEQSWLRVLTFAFSEYAYYYSGDRFWQGFCERLDLPHGQGVENTFRRVVEDGVNSLGLVQAKGGYRYVSTLWLQSGIPEQNLNHFAQLVQELADEYGWWELAHTDSNDLSEEVLSFCRTKYYSCRSRIENVCDSDDSEPLLDALCASKTNAK